MSRRTLDDLDADEIADSIKNGSEVLLLCGGCGEPRPHVLSMESMRADGVSRLLIDGGARLGVSAMGSAIALSSLVAVPAQHAGCHAPRRRLLARSG